MNIPLDRLYNFLHDLCNQDILIYRFYPHGSKKVEDFSQLNQSPSNNLTHPVILCYDQEPLFWNNHESEYGCNLRSVLSHHQRYRHVLLLHSEKNSKELEHFINDRMIPIYYWSHAMIARDWFRYAELDPALSKPKTITKDFLVYQRAWSNTREYRLKFTELVVNNNLLDSCNIKFNPVDEGHYRNHKFLNPSLTINRYDFETLIPLNLHDSHSSADYNNEDYSSTRIEVVLETIFDDTRWHLTEKILRPIACGQPFMLAATPGSLEYLRSYGFKTFAPYINEDYDQEPDSLARLEMIVAEMRRISSLSDNDKQELTDKIDEIAQFNKDLFFSDKWQDTITQELKNNLDSAIAEWQSLANRRLQPRGI